MAEWILSAFSAGTLPPKRDTAIAESRRVYRKDIKRWSAATRLSFPNWPFPKTGPNTAQLIASRVPKDKPFTIPEMMHRLHDATGKSDNEPTVRTYISRLCSRGAIRKLYKTGQNYALRVASESAVEEGPIDTRSLHEVVAQILVEEGRGPWWKSWSGCGAGAIAKRTRPRR